jgi:hypothetical protein
MANPRIMFDPASIGKATQSKSWTELEKDRKKRENDEQKRVYATRAGVLAKRKSRKRKKPANLPEE